MAVAEITNVVIEKGTHFEGVFNLFDPDQSATALTDVTAVYATIRKYPGSSKREEFAKNITEATGTIKLTLTEEQTSRLTPGRNYFDVVLTILGKKSKVIKGTAIVSESISV